MFRAFKKAYEDEIKGHGLFFFLCLFFVKTSSALCKRGKS